MDTAFKSANTGAQLARDVVAAVVEKAHKIDDKTTLQQYIPLARSMGVKVPEPSGQK